MHCSRKRLRKREARSEMLLQQMQHTSSTNTTHFQHKGNTLPAQRKYYFLRSTHNFARILFAWHEQRNRQIKRTR